MEQQNVVRMQDALTLEALMTVNAFLDIKVGCKQFQDFFEIWIVGQTLAAKELDQRTGTGQPTQF